MKRFGFLSSAAATAAGISLLPQAAKAEPSEIQWYDDRNDRIQYAKYDTICNALTMGGKKLPVKGTFVDGIFTGVVTMTRSCVVIGTQFFVLHKGYAIHQMQRKLNPITLINGDSLTLTWTINNLYHGTWERV